MRYPFLYKSLGKIDLEKISKDCTTLNEKIQIYDDWYLNPFRSKYLEEYISQNFAGMQIYEDVIYLSHACKSKFHIDMRHTNYITHRILIPLDTHFHYEWFVNDQLHRYKPTAGEILLFNNLVPHRFVLDPGTTERRWVIFFNIIDPNANPHLSQLPGLHEKENENLDEIILQKLENK